MSDDELKRLLEDFLSGDEGAPAEEYLPAEEYSAGEAVLPEQELLRVPTMPEAEEYSASGVDQLLAAVLEYTHQLDLDRCLIALLEETGADPAHRQVVVRAVWDRAGQEASFLGNRFSPAEMPLLDQMGPEDQVVVADFATSDKVDDRTRATFQHLGVGAAAILPLAVGGQLLGWLLAETVGRAHPFARQEVAALQSIADQASVALENLGLLKETRARAIQLQAAAEISSAASSLLDVDELLALAVELIRERFRLYYVGIFLLEGAASPGATDDVQDGSVAVLRAGTGQAGRQMMEEGYRLAVGEGSMIGWCVANSRARIALDVGQDAVHFDNPLLPETRSEMALPLNSRGRVVGAMTIQSTLPAAFDEADVAVLQIMADQLANAIENARLFQERERRITELAIVNEIGASLATALRLDVLLEIVHEQVSRLYDADNFYVAIYEEGDEWWTSAFRLEGGVRQPRARHSIDAGLTGHIIRTRQPVLLRSMQGNFDLIKKHDVKIVGEMARSWLGVPLIVSEKLVGVMAIQDYTREHLYGESDLALFATIGAQVAGALDNVRLLEETRRRAREMEVINEVGRTIASLLDLDEALRQIVDVTKERFGHYFVSISLVEGEWLVFRQGSTIGDTGRRLGAEGTRLGAEGTRLGAEGTRLGAEGVAAVAPLSQVLTVSLDQPQSLIAEAARTGQPVLVGDVAADPRYLLIEELPDTGTELAVPIEVKGRVIGTLDVQSSDAFSYDQTDVVLLQALASQAGVAIENARLFGETRRQADEFAVLHQSSLELTQEQRELDVVLATAARRLMELLDSDGSGVWLWQEAEQELELVLNYQVKDVADSYMGKRLKPGEGLTGRAFAEKRILVVDDYLAWNGMSSSFDDAPFAAALAAPMTWRGQVVGVLVTTRSQPGRPYLPSEQNLAELLAGQAAAVIQNARLFSDAQARAEQLAVANEVGQAVISVLDVDAVLRQIVDTIKERLGYFFVGILLLEGKQLVFRSGSLIGNSDTRWERGEMRLELDGYGLTVAAATRGESILVNDVSKDSRYGTVESLEPVLSELDTPIRVKARGYSGEGRVIGVLTVQSDRLGAFDQSDQELLQALANQAGVAIENARLFAETENALAEMEALYNTSRLLASARDLQEVLAAVAEGMYVSDINRAVLWEVARGIRLEGTRAAPRSASARPRRASRSPGSPDGQAVAVQVAANWHSGEGTEPLPVGTRFALESFPAASVILTPSEIFVEDVEKDERLDRATREALVAQKARAVAILPLWIGRRQIGVLMLVAEKPHRFTPREMRPYRSLAGQMAVVIEKNQLFEETERRTTELESLYETSLRMSTHLETPELLTFIVEQATTLLGAETAGFYLYEHSSNELVFSVAVGYLTDFVGQRLKPGEGLAGHVFKERQAMTVENYQAWSGRSAIYEQEERLGMLLAVPLLGRDAVLGVLDIAAGSEKGAFEERDLWMAELFAAQAATALENTRLFEETQVRAEELVVLNEMGRALTAQLNVGEVLDNIYHYVSRLFDATNSYVALYDAEADEISFPLAVENGRRVEWASRRSGNGLTEYVIRTANPLLIQHDVDDYIAELEGVEQIGQTAESWLGVPVLIGDRALGVIAVQSYEPGRLYTERNRDLLVASASHAAIAIQNAYLFEEEQRARALLGLRVNELDCLNDIGRAIDEGPAVPDLLEWMAGRIPGAMQFPQLAVAAIEFEGRIYGRPEAMDLPCQIVQALHIGAASLTENSAAGRVCIAYQEALKDPADAPPEDLAFLDEESALLGDITRRLTGYIENQRLLAETREAAQRLEREGSLLRTVIDNLPDHIYAKDRQSRFTANNLAHLQMMGASSQEEVLGKTDLDVFPHDLATLYYDEEQEIMRTGEVQAGHEHQVYYRATGELIWAVSTKLPLRGPDGEIYGLVGLTRNITERKRAEEIEQRRQRQLQCLSDIGQQAGTSPSVSEFLDWVAARIPAALQYPDFGLAAIEYEGELYGSAAAAALLGLPGSPSGPEVEDAQGLACQMVQNLRIGKEVVGRICIAYVDPASQGDTGDNGAATLEFLDEESALLGDIGRRVAGFLENRRLFEQAEARAAELAVLNELGQALPTRLDVDSVLFEAYHAASRLLDASDFYVTIYEAGQHGVGQITFPLIVEGGQASRPYHRRPADRRGLTEYLVEARRPLLIRDRVGEHAASLVDELGIESISLGSGRQALSWLGVPMIIGDRVLGTMVALSFTQSGVYDEHDLELLVAIANRVAVALENVHLLERAQARAEQERLVRTITDRVRRGVDREAIMRVALREMGEMLGASTAVVRLGTREQLLGTPAADAASLTPAAPLTGAAAKNEEE